MPNTPRDPDAVCLETARLIVTFPRVADAAQLAAYVTRNEAHLRAFNPPQPPDFHTESFWQSRIERSRGEYAADTAARLVVRYRTEPERVIASVNLNQIFRGPLQCAVLGYSVDAQEQGKGVMTEALRSVVGFAFETLRLHRIEASYLPTNERSGAVLRRLGFVVEGYARDYLFIHGAWRDHVRTALTNPHPEDPAPLG